MSEQWIKNDDIHMLEVEFQLQENRKIRSIVLTRKDIYWSNVSLSGGFLMRSVSRINPFFEKELYINILPFPKHDDRGKAHVMMVLTVMEIEEAEKKVPEAEQDLDRMAQQAQNLFKFIDVYNQMGFYTNQCLTITKAIIELSDYSGDPNLV